ncbi:MAG: DUF6933 domain-containing protein [Acidimicrobiales bacterium]
MLVRCTSRMLKAVGVGKLDLVENAPSDDDWYANLLWLTGRKCVLRTHAGSLFSVFVPDVSVGALRPIGKFVVPVVQAEIRAEVLSPDTFGNLDPRDVHTAKTASCRVLGCMNDLAAHCEWAVDDAGGLAHLDVPRLNHQLRRTILGPLGSRYPIEAARG